ncbi:NERD domain-containing protein [Oceanobacillus sp. CAU 1775]
MAPIAQLIKLQDYITRYEWDTYRYPTQYIRLKKANWEKLYEAWKNPEEIEEVIEEPIEEESSSMFSRVFDKFKKQKVESEVISEPEVEETNEPLPKTELELKQQYLDNLLNFQMKWATSTVSRSSFVDRAYYKDPLLKYLLQRFPDTFLLMYYPIFEIKKAPIESDIIMITPIGIEIIQFVELDEDVMIMAGDERTWHVDSPTNPRKILNPTISLRRAEKLVKSILATEQVDFAVRKTVLSRTNRIVYGTAPFNTQIVGKEDYDEWFQTKRKLVSPLKSSQIKAAEVLLKHCQTLSVRRPEWEEDDTSTIMDEED